ncbi:MAG: hypothetical protein L0220_31040 [Acidobacteria bacterium]|nr:hypothetical protein [Acidobacteriota bacterium]
MNGTLREEYEAIRRGVAVFDFSSAGKLKLSGQNAMKFLNGLVSNDVNSLKAGEGLLAAFPNLQGKLVALCRIYQTGNYLLLELDSINRQKIFANLSRFVPAGEFFVTDLSDQYALFSLAGPHSAELIEASTGQRMATNAPFEISERQLGKVSVIVTEHRRCGVPGYDLFVPADAASQAQDTLLGIGEEYGARPAGEAAFEIARIEAGIPREGVDAGENYIILESELNDAVSYTKGCYLGQEVIARIHWRGQPAKRLRGLLIDADQVPSPGTQLYAGDGKKAGEVTSSTRSIALDALIALAYVHRYYLTPGTEFTLKDDQQESGRARLVELPFFQS